MMMYVDQRSCFIRFKNLSLVILYFLNLQSIKSGEKELIPYY